MDEKYQHEIKKFRDNLDIVDQEIINLFSQRFGIVREIGELKKEYNILPLQKKRWEEVLDKVCQNADKKGLSKNFVKDVWNIIHNEALRIEKK